VKALWLSPPCSARLITFSSSLLLKHIYRLTDEGVCERWFYDPHFQHFTGETFCFAAQ
jgi:hypothetical protein